MPPTPCLRAHGTAVASSGGWSARLTAVVVAAACLGMGSTAATHAAQSSRLDTEIRATWTGVPLRDWADRISDLIGCPVIVDRRLDPDSAVTISCEAETPRSLLDRVAASVGGAMEPLDSTVWLVPRAATGRVSAAEAVRETAVRRLPAAMRATLAERAAWTWHAGATPRQLVENLAVEAGLPLRGLDRIPHDHVPAASLGPLTLAERLDLILAHYDLRIAWSAAGGDVAPIDDLGPHAGAPPRGRQRRPAAGGRTPLVRDAYSLKLEAPFDVALPAVAKQLGLKASLDEASLAARGIAAAEIVRVNGRDLSRDDLLDALVAPLGLAWSIDGTTLRVFAPPPSPVTRP